MPEEEEEKEEKEASAEEKISETFSFCIFVII